MQHRNSRTLMEGDKDGECTSWSGQSSVVDKAMQLLVSVDRCLDQLHHGGTCVRGGRCTGLKATCLLTSEPILGQLGRLFIPFGNCSWNAPNCHGDKRQSVLLALFRRIPVVDCHSHPVCRCLSVCRSISLHVLKQSN